MQKIILVLAALCAVPGIGYANTGSCGPEIERGIASWYGPGFSGGLTTSHEIYDPASFSAAHPSLPFGTLVKVTNMRNARSVTVRINDRGAFGKNRVIDLSAAAAAQLGMISDGVAPVAIYQCEQKMAATK